MTGLREEQLLGSWRLVRWCIDYPDGRRTFPFGEDACGLLIYAADGGMSATMQRRRRTPLDAAVPARASVETRAKVVDEYLAYAGTWELVQDSIVHRVTCSANPQLIGTEQHRGAQLTNDRLSLTAIESAPMARTHRIEWQRGAG